MGRFYKVDGNNLERAYKDHLSNFRDWSQKDHADKWVLMPQNIGKYLSIDETMLCKDLFTFLTNKDGHGCQNSLIAAVRGTTSSEVVKRLMEIPEQDRLAVEEEVTMDFSYSMFSIVSQVFPNATIVIDCFHVMMRLGVALEEMRMRMKRLAQKEQKKEERLHKKKYHKRTKARLYYRKKHPKKRGEKRGRPRMKRKNEKFAPKKLSNNETKLDLLTHLRYPLLSVY